MADVTDDCVYIGNYRTIGEATHDFDLLWERHRSAGLGVREAAVLIRNDDGRIRVIRRTRADRSPTDRSIGLAALLQLSLAFPVGGTGIARDSRQTWLPDDVRGRLRQAIGHFSEGGAALAVIGERLMRAQLGELTLVPVHSIVCELRSGPEICDGGLQWVVRALGTAEEFPVPTPGTGLSWGHSSSSSVLWPGATSLRARPPSPGLRWPG